MLRSSSLSLPLSCSIHGLSLCFPMFLRLLDAFVCLVVLCCWPRFLNGCFGLVGWILRSNGRHQPNTKETLALHSLVSRLRLLLVPLTALAFLEAVSLHLCPQCRPPHASKAVAHHGMSLVVGATVLPPASTSVHLTPHSQPDCFTPLAINLQSQVHVGALSGGQSGHFPSAI